MPDSVAEVEYRILLEFKPDDHKVRTRLGMVLFRQEKLDEAAEEFKYVLGKQPENAGALTGLARVNMKLGRLDRAAELLIKALAADPDDLHNYFYLGQAREKLGDMEAAEEIYRTGLFRPLQENHTAEDRKILEEALVALREQKEKQKEADK